MSRPTVAVVFVCLLAAAKPSVALVGEIDFKSLQTQVADIRGLPFKHPVAFEVLSRGQIVQNLTTEIDHETDFEGYTAWLKAFGFVPDDFPTRQVMLSLYGEQVGGYYDPRTGKFYLNSDSMRPAQTDLAAALGLNMEEMTIAHELTHALQDQHFGLQRIEDSVDRGTEDQKLAVSALFEGDATDVMIEQPLKKLGLDPSALGALGDLSSLLTQSAFGDGGQFPQFEKAPLVFRESMMFPYIDGLKFISTLRKNGGWAAVNSRYTNLPASTQEILDGGTPVPSGPRLQFSVLTDIHWKQVTRGTLGAFLYGVFLEQYAPTHPTAHEIRHWQADTYEVYQDAARHCMLRWASRWDDEPSATAVFDLLSAAMPQRHPGLSWHPDGAGRVRWQDASGRSTILQRSARQVVLVDGVPTGLVEQALHMEALR